MKQLAVLSFFRNSDRTLGRYFKQVRALRDYLDATHWRVRVIAVWGDCIDNTEHNLPIVAESYGIALETSAFHHGHPWFGSTEEPLRLSTLSRMANHGLDLVRGRDDYVWYVESDLLWTPDVPAALVGQMGSEDEWDILAPMTFAGDAFYDIWAFRLGTNPDGTDRRFSPFPPFHPELHYDGPTKVDSVGSALMIRGDVARRVRMTADRPPYALVSFCHNARAMGYTVGTDARLRIRHP